MTEIKGTETEKNLLKAFEGEALARTRYSAFASKAKLDGYNDVAKVFEEFSNNEKEHALVWLKWICDKSADTKENLKTAITAENFENSKMYPDFAKKAREEGFENLAELFEYVQKIEESHEQKFKMLLDIIKNKDVTPDINGNYKWKCSICGCIMEQNDKPEFCPLCSEPEAFFYKTH